jgi:hypothetical protein
MKPVINITGMRFGRWTVLAEFPEHQKKHSGGTSQSGIAA